MTENREDAFDAFDTWLNSCPAASPPVGLVERCLATIPETGSSITVARPTRQRGRALKVIAVGTAIAATVVVAWLGLHSERSAFAEAIRQTTHANAVHILETFTDPERSPGELRTSEWWIRPGVGMKRVVKVNGEMAYVFVTRDGETTNWFPGENSVVIKRDSHPVDDFPYFTSAILAIKKIEQMASDQKIPLTQQEIVKPDGKIRRLEIKDLREVEQPNAVLMLSLIVDIDDVTNRIVRKWSHEWAVGKHRENFATGNATSVMEIDYPTPDSLPESLFRVEYPSDAKVTRADTGDQNQ